MKEDRFVKPLVDGEDLKEMGLKPGPIYREILNRVKYAILDGEISADDHQEQRSYLQELVNEVKERNLS